MNTVMLGCWAYNLVFVCEGKASRLNVIGLVLCSVYLAGRLYLMVRRPRRMAKS